MLDTPLPSRSRMVRAMLERDGTFDGIFVTAVRTTRIFCHPSCPGRKPKPENVEFYRGAVDALAAGYRPCKRCQPLAAPDAAPAWLRPVLEALDADPTRRWRDADLRRLGVDPARVARWFKQHHGVTFHAYSRARRLGSALRQIRGGRTVTSSAFDIGYESVSAFNEAVQRFAGASPVRGASARIVHVMRLETPLGSMIAGDADGRLVLLEFVDRRMLPTQFARLARAMRCVFEPSETPLLVRLRGQLEAYFRGELAEFDVPLETPGSEFQREVWEALRRIPAGETRSYGDIARTIGRPSAVRAVARANGDNRIAIIIPCHRVVGSDGKLVGYGGGLWRKKRLLELESRLVPAVRAS